jgi:hypothetical protein
MPEKSDYQIALFVRDEKTGRHAFNAKALKALGVDPAEARERGYPLQEPNGSNSAAKRRARLDSQTRHLVRRVRNYLCSPDRFSRSRDSVAGPKSG